jgi:hypothetical protein
MQRYSKLPGPPRFCRSTSVRNIPVARPRIHEVRRRLSQETIAQLVADYEAGQSTPALEAKYGVAKATVLKLLEEHGVTMRHQLMTETETAEAIQLYQQGWSLARVGEHLGRNPSTIQGVLRRAGVARRQRWERPK